MSSLERDAPIRRSIRSAVLELLLGIVVACFSVSSARAKPENPMTVADARCMVVGARFAESPDQRLKISGEMLLSYFLGRIDGRSPHVDLESLIAREAGKMTTSDLKDAARRCGTEFSARGVEITHIGKDLARMGK